MARMSSDDERKSVKYGDSSQLTNWILDSGATCHMTPEVSYFIPGLLEYTDKYIETILIAAQVLVGIVKDHMLFRQSAHFVEITITLQKNSSKG